ncbi:MAG: aldo/keto reductase family protein [Actinomycetaceae bacterium]|nr:aldo/keto reductase family protein [Arcanobacterium sp.]MDD7687391.1 aldo/keto reductase family protein [Actinomycetaceae bacterium]MDY5272866.1 aldo/keto reductase family protein [Arcanobacterium sp.]
MVDYVYLGHSGLKISNVILGNWLTHGQQIDKETAIACVHAALDAGITTFDTADVYANGKAEKILGKALKGMRRESLEIFTKVYWPVGPGGHNDVGLSRKHIMESIDASLKRLGTDYVDVYQAHRFDVETPIEETMQAFADVVHAGKALYIGVSEWTAQQIRYAHDFSKELGFQVVSNQPQYSMLWRVIEPEVIPTSQELGISQIVWSPMAQGVLSGKYVPGEAVPHDSRAASKVGTMMGDFLTDSVLEAVERLKPIALDLGITQAQLALAWVLHNSNVAAPIIGASRPEQIAENVEAADVTLDDSTMAAIDEALGDVVIRDPRLTWERAPHIRPA